MLESNICLAPLRTRHGLAKGDLEYDLLADTPLIYVEERNGDREGRVRA
jgi:hypothetical protein